MSDNLDMAPRVFLHATEDTATSAAELTTKPERRCDIILESQDGGAEITVANNVPWAYGHVLKAQFEGLFELALGLQEQPPRRERPTGPGRRV